jgi:basic amino acid/polyamine antiporter, APA family
MRPFATKPLAAILEEARDEGAGLRRRLGAFDLLALGIGGTIGVGIFVLTGVAAARYAGPAVMLSFVFAGLVCTLTALCYTEFAALLPVSGSAYTYSYATLGELFAWVVGWDLLLEYAVGAATLASGWGATFESIVRGAGVGLPAALSHATGTALVSYEGAWRPLASVEALARSAGVDALALPRATAVFNVPAAAVALAVTALLMLGVREGARLNSLFAALKVVTVFAFLAVGAAHLIENPGLVAKNWEPFLPANQGEFGAFGWSGVARAASIVFFSYLGFDSVSTAAQEAKRPQRDLPVAILGTLGICTVLYVVVVGVLTAIVPYERLDVGAPVALALDATGARWGGALVKAGTLLGVTTNLFVVLYAQSRILFTMARDGLLPRWVGAVHAESGAPRASALVVGAAVAALAGLFPIAVLGDMVSIGTLFAFSVVCVAVLVLRARRPDLPRPFRTPWVPLVPVAGALLSLAMMLSLPGVTWVRFVVWLALGAVLYAAYGARKSRWREGAGPPA